jgi:hypothetical protein
MQKLPAILTTLDLETSSPISMPDRPVTSLRYGAPSIRLGDAECQLQHNIDCIEFNSQSHNYLYSYHCMNQGI